MNSSFSSDSRLTHSVALSCLFCFALAASAAHACPPGTMPDPNYNPSGPVARAHPQRCVPAPKPPTAKYIGTTGPDVEHTDDPTARRRDDRSAAGIAGGGAQALRPSGVGPGDCRDHLAAARRQDVERP